MPEEDVVLRFGQEGAEGLARSIEQLRTGVQGLTQTFAQASGASETVTASAAKVETGTRRLHGEFRVGARVAVGLAGDLANQLNPTLGKMASNLTLAVSTAAAFGIGVGAITLAVGALTDVVTSWVQENKRAEEFQLRLTRAVKQMDLGPVLSQLQDATLQSQRYGEMTDELRQKIDQLRQTARFIFAQEEAPKLQIELLQEQWGLAKQIADSEAQRARTVDEVTEALERQQQAARAIADLRAEEIERATQPRVRQLRELGLTAEAAQVEAQAAARAAVVRARAQQESEAQELEAQQREVEIIRKGMEEGLAVVRSANEQREALQRASREREIAEIEESNRSAVSKVQGRTRMEERATRESLDQRLSLIDVEMNQLEEFARQYPEVREVQEQVDRRLIQLQTERVRAEVDADSQILQQRRQMLQQMRALAQQEAAIGGDITALAQERLRTQGITRFTREDIARTTEEIRREQTEVAGRFARGEEVTAEELQQLQRIAPIFQRMMAAGVTPGGALGQMGAQFEAGLAGRQAPIVPGGGIGGLGAFDPTGGMSLQEYMSRLELARAQEQIVDVTAGLPPRIDSTMQQVEAAGTATIERVLERVPPLLGDLFDRFTEELIRKIEFEAARA